MFILQMSSIPSGAYCFWFGCLILICVQIYISEFNFGAFLFFQIWLHACVLVPYKFIYINSIVSLKFSIMFLIQV